MGCPMPGSVCLLFLVVIGMNSCTEGALTKGNLSSDFFSMADTEPSLPGFLVRPFKTQLSIFRSTGLCDFPCEESSSSLVSPIVSFPIFRSTFTFFSNRNLSSVLTSDFKTEPSRLVSRRNRHLGTLARVKAHLSTWLHVIQVPIPPPQRRALRMIACGEADSRSRWISVMLRSCNSARSRLVVVK